MFLQNLCSLVVIKLGAFATLSVKFDFIGHCLEHHFKVEHKDIVRLLKMLAGCEE